MRTLLNFVLCLLPFLGMTQQLTIEGYVYEENNRGYIKDAKIALLNGENQAILQETLSDQEGKFILKEVEKAPSYIIVVNHTDFLAKEMNLKASDFTTDKAFSKLELKRKPGYIFDVTISEKNNGGLLSLDAIVDSRIEIYNNTSKKEELVLEKHPNPTFNFNFQTGNHYTIMIRKEGYLAKRMEAYVDVDGCILCFDGVGEIAPNVTDVMTHGNEMGTFLANVELEPLVLEKTFTIENIYYDYNKWDIREDAAFELDKIVTVLKDNPAITVELGSHTDARGKDSYNLSLSQKRAAAAVDYLVTTGGIEANRLSSRGYGESLLINSCRNGVQCSEEAHQENRRTELKIVGIDEQKQTEIQSLKRIIEEEKAMQEVLNSEEIYIPENIEVRANEKNDDNN